VTVYVLIVLAAAALGVGVIADNQTLVYVALGMSVVAALLIVVMRLLPGLRASDSPDDDGEKAEVGDESDAEQVEASPADDLPATDEALEPVDESPAESPAAAPENTQEEDAQVVFVTGRTAFHAPDCELVASKTTSSAYRDDLEANGMTACQRCLVA